MFEFIKRYFKNALKGGKAAIESIRFMWSKKTYFIFSLLYFLFTLLILGVFISLLFSIVVLPRQLWKIIFFISLIFTLLALSMVSIFCSAATINYTFAQFNESPITVTKSFKMTMVKFWVLFKLSFINAIIRFLTKKRDSNASGIIGTGFFWFLNLSWSMLSLAVVPILLTTDKNVFEALKESYQIMKNNFGVNSGGLASFSIVNGTLARTLYLFIFSIVIGLSFLINPSIAYKVIAIIKAMITGSKGSSEFLIKNSSPTILLLSLLPSLGLLVVPLIIKTAKDIFKAAVYQYSQGKSTGPFSTILIKTETSFQKK